jgi:hypothetical protein
MNRPNLAVCVLGLTIVLACGGADNVTAPPKADPGPVNLILSTPNANDGAVLVNVAGGPVSTVVGQGYEIAATTPGATGVRLLVRGAIVAGSVAQIDLPDRKKLAQYHVTVEQVAARSTYQQRNPAGYSVTLSVP